MNMEKFFEKDEVDLGEYLKIIIKRRITFFAAFIAYIFIVAIVVALLLRQYETMAIVRIGSIDKPLMNKRDAEIEIKSAKNIAKFNQLKGLDIDIVATQKKTNNPRLGEEDLISVKARQTDPELAKEICNGLADIFVAEGNKIYDKEIAVYKEELGKLEKSKLPGDYDKILNLKLLLARSKNFEVSPYAILPCQPMPIIDSLDTIIILVFTGVALALLIVSFQEFWEKNTKKDGWS